MNKLRSTLIVYNTADRLLRGDYFHTVSVSHINEDMRDFPVNWLTIGIGTTNWMGRNGEVIIDGRVDDTRYYWADPDSDPAGEILDLASENPRETGKTPLVTPEVDVDDTEPHFPFVAMCVCNPSNAIKVAGDDIEDVHAWIIAALEADNWGLVGVRLLGDFTVVETTDAFNLPLGGLDLSDGYTGEDHFRMETFTEGRWEMRGVYTANPSLRPFVTVPTLPLHLHGYEISTERGGHIIKASAATIEAELYPIDDLTLSIHNLAKASNPVKPMD